MIDLKFLRENPEVVKQNIKNKFQDHKLPLVDEVIELDAEARKTQQEADDLARIRISPPASLLRHQAMPSCAKRYSTVTSCSRVRKSCHM